MARITSVIHTSLTTSRRLLSQTSHKYYERPELPLIIPSCFSLALCRRGPCEQ